MFAQTKSGSSLPSEDSQQSLESVMCSNNDALLFLLRITCFEMCDSFNHMNHHPFHFQM
ncbi:hypothetical protein [Bacillus pseudomycoides]|uniref:hypothetical protein n=1 Tax=Bacillus pseudomycoides TaxID=64104 RepID=UPI0015CF4F66|nr:hypothetical protein [Bacillus pseudomycoides]